MATTDPRVLELSGDSQALMKTAVEFAKSRFPTDHNRLLEYLAREEFLDRLDSEDDYLGPPTQLRLARVIKLRERDSIAGSGPDQAFASKFRRGGNDENHTEYRC